MKRLYMMAGNPGSGKSYIAKALQEYIEGSVLLQSDVVRHELFPEPKYIPDEHKAVFDVIHHRIDDAFKSDVSVVIFDATNKTHWERKIPNIIAEHFNARTIVIYVDTPEDVIFSRLKNRTKDENMSDAGLDVYLRMREKKFQEPSGLWLAVNGADPIGVNLKKILFADEEYSKLGSA